MFSLILTLVFACSTASQTPTVSSSLPEDTESQAQPQTRATDAHELAKKLSNPVASLISFPFQSNFDFGMSSTFLQPFLAYNTKDAWTYTINAESSYDWIGNNCSVPINFTITRLTKFGAHPVSLGGGIKCWANSGPGGRENCGVRIVVTPLFPR